MKIIGVIPARYASTRFPGKPLADICGKPMIWWVYNRVIEVKEFSAVYVATDSEKIKAACSDYNIPVIMTGEHPEHISRIHEVSECIEADFYVCVNGDEPLIDPKSISRVIPSKTYNDIYFGGAMRILNDAAKVIDNGNIKLAANSNGRCIYMSRTPIPYPQSTVMVDYRKYVGIECFNKRALDFFVSTEKGKLETIEDIDHLRFLENGVPIYFTEVESESLSVDTSKDLDYVKQMISKQVI